MPKQYDLAIVGSGILGAMAAFHVLKQDKRVLMIDAGNHPNDATVRNFGSLVPSGQATGALRSLGAESLTIYQILAKAWGLPIRKTGTTFVAQDAQEAQVLHEKYVIEQSRGFNPVLLNPKQLADLQPSLHRESALLGLHFSDELSVDSADFMALFLQKLAQRSQLDKVFSTPIIDISGKMGDFTLHASTRKSFHAQQVLFCCGHKQTPFMQSFYANEPLRLCKLQMMKTKPLAKQVVGNLLGGLSIRRYEGFADCASYNQLTLTAEKQTLENEGIHVLFKQTAKGEIIIGDSHHYYPLEASISPDFYLDANVNRLLLDEANTLMSIDSADIDQHWLGWYVDHPDGALKKSPQEGLHIVTGLGGKGMTVGPALMSQVIEEIFHGNALRPMVK